MPFHVRCDCPTDPACGCPPRDRALADYVRWGVVVLDKPPDCTSRRAADRVRRALGAARVGHGGTLDPAVTGVLPVLLDRATPVAAVLLSCDKAYEGAMQLHGDVPDDKLAAAVVTLRGVIVQTPPRRSRVKRAPRERAVHAFDVTRRSGRRAEFSVRCQGGTYVRKLIHDLGRHLGCGAHMISLRRTRAGPFTLNEAVVEERVLEAAHRAQRGDETPLRALVWPVDEVVCRVLPRVSLDDGAVDAVCCGVPLAVPGVCGLDEFGAGDEVAMTTLKGELIGLGQARMGSAELQEAQNGLAVLPRRILMARGVYPGRGAAS
jgi:H/ACA ribonucleoprotein complex subunit 4